jgi:hypothetical protein
MFVISLKRSSCLILAAGMALAVSSGPAAAASFAKYDGVDGESHVAELGGLEIKPFGAEPFAGMLLPAVQAAREAARINLSLLACDGTVIPELILEIKKGEGRRPHLIYKLKDVIVTSYEMQSSNGNGSSGLEMNETATITYTGLEWTNTETGEHFVLDCAGGRCVCVDAP